MDSGMPSGKEQVNYLLNMPRVFANEIGFDLLTDLHNDWLYKMINSESDITIQAHRGSYKTSCVSVALAILIILYPNLKIAFLRKTDTDVKEIVEQTKKILQQPLTKTIVKDLYNVDLNITVDNATQLSTNLNGDIKGAPQLWAFGIGSSITGKHFDRIFTDDIVNINDRTSRAERERTKLAYQELQNLKNKGGVIINTGTPWSKDDAFSIMPKPVKYDCYSTGILNDEEIKELKSKMTASLFAANYELKHIASDDVIFSNPITNENPELIKNGTSHCDAAFYGEDFTAFTIVAIHDGNYFVFGKCWRKHIDDVMDEIVELHNKYLCQKMYNEKNADKGYVAKAFRNKGVKVVTYNESQNKYMKITTHLKGVWDKIRFVKGTDPEYIDMICDYNENAEHDDACLVGNTLIATTRGNIQIKDIKKGDYVLTPMGARKVIDCGMTAKNVDVFDYNGVVATPNHKFYDKTNNRFTRADCLTFTASYDIISLKELIIWKRRLLYSMGLNIGEARRANIISSIQQEIVREKTPSSCTEPFGNTIMAKFRKGITFIILTVISTITTLPIWSVYRLRNICQCTQRKILKTKKQERKTENSLQKRLNLQKNGINPKQAENGTGNTRKTAFSKRLFTISQKFVNFARRNFSEQQDKNFAQLFVSAKQERQELINSEQKSDCAKTAEKSMKQNLISKNIVPQNANTNFIGKADVYNLTIENAGCFYANGILVSNCDSLASLVRVVKIKDNTRKSLLY